MTDETVKCKQTMHLATKLLGRVQAHYKDSFERTYESKLSTSIKQIFALYIENRILNKILKYQTFVKRNEIEDKTSKETTNRPKYRHARRFSEKSHLVKLIRAQGGCLGTKSRRKTW